MGMMLRRRMLQMLQKVGSSDYFLENVIISSGVRQNLPIKLLDSNSAFTVLVEYQELQEYEGSYYNMDIVSCGQSQGNFSTAIRICRYAQYAMCRLNNGGKDENLNTYPELKNSRMKFVLRFNPATTPTSTFYINDLTPNTRTQTITLNDGYVNIGGQNGGAGGDSTGKIWGLYIYKKALTDTQISDYITNSIIP